MEGHIFITLNKLFGCLPAPLQLAERKPDAHSTIDHCVYGVRQLLQTVSLNRIYQLALLWRYFPDLSFIEAP